MVTVPRFAANISLMFTEVPFLERFAAAADAGFPAVEFLFPYEFEASAIVERLRATRLENALFNLPPGDLAAGDRGMACLPGREAEFRGSLETALRYADVLGTRRLHCMAGIVPEGAERGTRGIYASTLIENLRDAADKAGQHGVTLLLEPLNTRDVPGYFYSRQAEAHAICQAVAAPNVKMQIDCYHMQIMEGDLEIKLRRYLPDCGHIQIAGVPRRNEPARGEVNYDYIFDLLDELGYTGWIGCEYRPSGKTTDGLGWLAPYGIGRGKTT